MRPMSRDRLTAILMITPSIILLAIFVYGFIGKTIYSSLTDWGNPDPQKKAILEVPPDQQPPDTTITVNGVTQSLADYRASHNNCDTTAPLSDKACVDFVGLKNYTELFTSAFPGIRFRDDLVNEIFFTIIFLVACLGLGLGMAMLLDQHIRGEGFFRTVFLFPMALAFVVTGVVWAWLFRPESGLNLLPSTIAHIFDPNVQIQPVNFGWYTDRTKLFSFTWQQLLIVVGILILLFMIYVATTYWFKNRRLVVYIIAGLGLAGGLFITGSFTIPAGIARESHGLNAALLAIVLAAVWQMSGYTMAIYLAGLRGIPEELREAARVDGCTELQVYQHVILPLLQPITLSAAIILGHISLKIFDLVYVMAGDNNLLVDVPGVNMYITTFRANNFALGSAMAIIMLILVAVIIVPYLATALRKEPSL